MLYIINAIVRFFCLDAGALSHHKIKVPTQIQLTLFILKKGNRKVRRALVGSLA